MKWITFQKPTMRKIVLWENCLSPCTIYQLVKRYFYALSADKIHKYIFSKCACIISSFMFLLVSLWWVLISFCTFSSGASNQNNHRLRSQTQKASLKKYLQNPPHAWYSWDKKWTAYTLGLEGYMVVSYLNMWDCVYLLLFTWMWSKKKWWAQEVTPVSGVQN